MHTRQVLTADINKRIIGERVIDRQKRMQTMVFPVGRILRLRLISIIEPFLLEEILNEVIFNNNININIR